MEVVLGAIDFTALSPVYDESPQTAPLGGFLGGCEDAASGAALGSVEEVLEGEGFADPGAVDGAAGGAPVAEELGVGLEFASEGSEFFNGVDYVVNRLY